MTQAVSRHAARLMQTGTIRLAPEFTIFRGVDATLEDGDYAHPALLGFRLREALEAAWLEKRGVAPDLARAAAARAAAQFVMAELDALGAADRAALPHTVPVMAAQVPPSATFLAQNFALGGEDAEILRNAWSMLGTAEALMETGGDIRLARDPRTALNGYGCSHRPRPWAVTFASSTASSSSERGYVAADLARLRATAAALRGFPLRRAVKGAIETARRGIAAGFGLKPEEKIILAASGTDTELLALALTHLDSAGKKILNILIAPEETGRGVPMAAKGRHFAIDTALGHDVTFEAPVEGFRPDTELLNIRLRETSGTARPMAAVEAEIEAAVTLGIAAGQRVILHGLDLSKTGLLAPSLACMARLRARHGLAFDIVLDACQARLSPVSVRAYLDLDAVVLVTGSKFFTGPPFAGAALLPASVAARLNTGTLPAGLAAYFGQDDFPPAARCAKALPPRGNFGLALRWHAALGEMKALLRVPPVRRAEILRAFGATVRAAIAAQPALTLLDAPPVYRTAADEEWERLPTIFTFSLRAPHDPARCLNPVEARQVYTWLNTDLSGVLPQEAFVAARICHIGQPVPLAQPSGDGQMGALRVSAGARLISGEPSHRSLAAKARLAQEFLDLNTVFLKIDLILRNWGRIAAADPRPSYRPGRHAPGAVPAA
jgi:selenocysteine lyase/cysteine desulfurase